VKTQPGRSGDQELVASLAETLRATEVDIKTRAIDLAITLKNALNRGTPLTEIGDRVATSLQTPRKTAGFDAGALS
jgi:hypothetical protein